TRRALRPGTIEEGGMDPSPGSPMPPGDARAPLEGVRVVDLSPDAVGAAFSQTLADYGADVVLVEPPGGSRLRSRASFPMLGRGKRSVVADLGTADGRERIR